MSEDFSGKKVLVVDDSMAIRQAIIRLLKDFGFDSFEEAEDGKIALDKVNKAIEDNDLFDLILCDINMPNMIGNEFVRKIKAMSACKDVPVVMISTESESSIILDSIAAGASNYILKPFDKDTVLKKINKVLK